MAIFGRAFPLKSHIIRGFVSNAQTLTETKYTETNTFGTDRVNFTFSESKLTNTSTFGTDTITDVLLGTIYTNSTVFGQDIIDNGTVLNNISDWLITFGRRKRKR